MAVGGTRKIAVGGHVFHKLMTTGAALWRRARAQEV